MLSVKAASFFHMVHVNTTPSNSKRTPMAILSSNTEQKKEIPEQNKAHTESI